MSKLHVVLVSKCCSITQKYTVRNQYSTCHTVPSTLSTHESLWIEIPYYRAFWVTATLNILPHIAVNKVCCCIYQDLTVFSARFVVDFGEAFIKSEKGTARHILFCDLCWTLNRTFTGIFVFQNVVLYQWTSGSW